MNDLAPILIVEDDTDIREALRDALEFEGYRTVTASNGQEALDLLLDRRRHRPSLILLDLMMPVMDGWQFLKKRKEHAHIQAIPVVVATAAGNHVRDLEDTAALIKKPVELDALFAQIRKLIQHPQPAST